MLTLSFGKHKGKPLSQIPSDYLAWLTETGIKSRQLAAAVSAERQRRVGRRPGQVDEDPPAPPRAGPGPDVGLAMKRLTAAIALLNEALTAFARGRR